jgi:hypothetical protein
MLFREIIAVYLLESYETYGQWTKWSTLIVTASDTYIHHFALRVQST